MIPPSGPSTRYLVPVLAVDPFLLALVPLGLLIGAMIGAVGVGGVLLAPLLVVIAGLGPHEAIPVASFSFLFAGIAGTVAYARRGTVDWRAAAWIGVAIVPAALLGARTNASLPPTVLTLALVAVIVLAVLRSLAPPDAASRDRPRPLPTSLLLALGTGVGFGSALTGTGGPVLLVPLLLLLRVPALAAVGVSQAIQLPVAAFASLGYAVYGRIDVPLGVALGIAQGLGVLVGARVAHAVPARRLRQGVTAALIGVAALLLARLG